MATERDLVNLSKNPTKQNVSIRDLTPEQRKARFTAILERGIINERLSVPLPDGVHGEWVRDDSVAISRMEALGFEIDTVHAVNRSLHSDGSGKAKVGDVIFMTCPSEIKSEIDAVKLERYNRMHNPSKEQESEEFKTEVNTQLGSAIPVIDTGSTNKVTGDQIKSSLQS